MVDNETLDRLFNFSMEFIEKADDLLLKYVNDLLVEIIGKAGSLVTDEEVALSAVVAANIQLATPEERQRKTPGLLTAVYLTGKLMGLREAREGGADG